MVLCGFNWGYHFNSGNKKSLEKLRATLQPLVTSTGTIASIPSTSKSDITLDRVLSAWKRGFRNCEEEKCELINADLPNDLVGTLYR
jgi:hypothetical protein